MPCAAGWDIPTALEDVLKDSAADDHFGANLQGKWMRPAKCLDLGYRSRNFNNDIEEAENAIWDPVSAMHACAACAACCG